MAANGVPLDHVHVVPDDQSAIVAAVRQELARGGPRLLVTSGGIGSTPDDITFESVAAALERDLELDELLAERFEGALAWQADLGMDVTAEYRWHMLRMARLPAGGRLLDPDRGFVPGIVVDVEGGCDDGGATIAILPGVPGEFRRLLDEVITPRLVAGRNPVPDVVEITHEFPESALNPMFAALQREHPDVKLGSYPGRRMLIRLTGRTDDVHAAAGFVRSHLDDLLATPGGKAMADAWRGRVATLLDEEDD